MSEASNIKVTIKLPNVTANYSSNVSKNSSSTKSGNDSKDNDKLVFQFSRDTNIKTVLDVLGIANQTKYLNNISLKLDGKILNEDDSLAQIIDEKTNEITVAVELKPYTTREVLNHVMILREFMGFSTETDDNLFEFAISTGINFNKLPLDPVKDKREEEVFEEVNQPEQKKNVFKIPQEEKNNTCKKIKDIFTSFENPNVKELLTVESNLITPCVRSLHLSQYNPVPGFYQSKGHLLYLQIITLEGENFHITSTPSGFYINRSTNTKFDPSHRTFEDAPQLNGKVYYNLFNLLAAHSKKFVFHVESMESKLGKLESVSYVKPQTTFLHKPWLVSTNPNNGNNDYFRLQHESIENRLSTERKFNDEFQAIKDIPILTLSNRLDSERLMAKLIHEFSVAATKGAMSILAKNVIPMNPESPEMEQIYLKDNIFYSFVSDVSGNYKDKGGNEAARVAANQDLLTISALNRVGLSDVRYLLTTIVDYADKRLLAQTPVPGLLDTMGAELVKDATTGKETYKDLESDIVVTYGLDESTGKVVQNKEFDDLLSKEFAKVFHLKKNNDDDVIFSSQSKGIIGLDKRHYVLDLANTYPLDINFVREHYDNASTEDRYPHRQTLLRPELIESWWSSKVDSTDNLDSSKAYDEGMFTYNPDAYQIEGVEDKTVDEISDYLVKTVIPTFVDDYVKANVSPPYNGEHLVDALHKNGINVRYIGKVAQTAQSILDEQITKHEERLKEIIVSNKEYEDWEASYLVKVEKMIKERQEEINRYVQAGKDVPKELTEDLKLDDSEIMKPTNDPAVLISRDELIPLIKISEVEMIARSVKHVLKKYSRELPVIIVSSLVAYVFNLLFGTSYNENPVAEEIDEFYAVAQYSFSKLTREDLVADIIKEVHLRFRYDLTIETLNDHLSYTSLLMREISYRFGIQWLNKNYFYTKDQFEEFKSHQDKKVRQKIVAPTTTFSKDDLVIIPRVKSSSFSSITSEKYWKEGTTLVTEGKQQEGLTLMAQSIAIVEEVQGIVHRDVAEKYLTMASIYSKCSLVAEAVAFIRKACVIYERVSGIDSFETIRALYNLSLLELANESPYNSTVIFNRIVQIMNAYNLHELHHPNSTAIFNYLEQIALGCEDMKLTIEILNKLSDFIVSIDGKDAIAYAYVQSQLGNLYATAKDYRAALEHISYAKNIFFNELGSNHTTTASSKQWINGLSNLIKDIHQKKQLNEDQMGAAGIQPGSTKKSHKKKTDSPNAELAEKSVDELLDFIEGDERKSSKKNKKKHSKK